MDANMPLFQLKLSGIEHQFLENVKKTKSVFTDETKAMESGLALMFDASLNLEVFSSRI
jgi:hypothetical protein